MMQHALSMLTLQFSVILLGVLVLRPLLRRVFGAACAYGGWLLVPLLMLVAQMPASRPGLALHRLVQADAATVPAIVATGEPELLPNLLLAWSTGVIVVLALLVLQQLRYQRTLRWDASQQHWRGAAGSGPGLMGLFPPRLVLPVDFESRFTPGQQQLILAHETVHRARGDNFWNLLAVLCCALQWFNPLAWWALRALRIDQELACDAAVLRRSPQQHVTYAQALISAQGLTAHGPLWSSWRSHHPLVERVAMLKFHALARRRGGLTLLLALGLLGAGTVHAWRSPSDGDSSSMVMLKMSLIGTDKVNGEIIKLRSSPRMLVALGSTASLTMGFEDGKPTDHSLSIEMTPVQTSAGHYAVKTQMSRGNPLKPFAEQELRVKDGELTTFDSGTDIEGRSLTLVLTASPHKGPVKPQP